MKKTKVLIAIPVYRREVHVVNCIRSLLETTIVDSSVEVTIAIAVNEMNDTLNAFFNDYIKTSKYPMHIHKMTENVGKGIAVNNVAAKYEFDYIVSLDSDMICLDSKWLMKMLSAYIIYNKKPYRNKNLNNAPRYLGSICANQSGLSGHSVDLTANTTININLATKLTLVTSIVNGGIAGGVLMSDVITWKRIGGYNGSRLFATDDGHYHADCSKHNRLVAYLKEATFYHPYELPDEYREWKNAEKTAPETFKAFQTEGVKLTDEN